jgi:hypothetical protein
MANVSMGTGLQLRSTVKKDGILRSGSSALPP